MFNVLQLFEPTLHVLYMHLYFPVWATQSKVDPAREQEYRERK